MTAAERVAEKAHWPSDVVTGMIVGVLGFRIALWCCLAATHPPLRESLRRSDHACPKT
jgi:membrane-associated phospholipid phosphatase